MLQETLDVKNRGSNGSILADKMGFGKTAEVLMMFVMLFWLQRAWAEIDSSRRRNDGLHNPENTPDKPCPSADKNQHFFACPCSNGIAHDLPGMKPGPSLFVVPPQLLDNWIDEIAKHISARLGLRLVVNRTPARASSAAELAKLFRDAEIWCRSTPSQKDSTAVLEKYFTTTIVKEGATEKSWYNPGSSYDRLMLVSSANVEARILKDKVLKDTRWSLLCVDEFHLNKGITTQTVRLALGLHVSTATHFLSATPFERSPKDMEPTIGTIQRRFVEFDSSKNVFVPRKKIADADRYLMPEAASLVSNMRTILPTWNKLTRAKTEDAHTRKNDQDQCTAALKNVFGPYLLRRTARSKWGKDLALAMPWHEHRDVICKWRDTERDRQAQAALERAFKRAEAHVKDGSSREIWLRKQRKARIGALIPHVLLKTPDDDDDDPLDRFKDTVNLGHIISNLKDCWLYGKRHEMRESPKLRELHDAIQRMGNNPLVIMANFPWEVAILYLVSTTDDCIRRKALTPTAQFLTCVVKKGDVEVIHPGVKGDERHAAAQHFQNEGRYQGPNPPRFIIGTFGCLGTGLRVQIAFG